MGQTTVGVTPALCAAYRSKTSLQSTSVRSAKGGGGRNERWRDGKESVSYTWGKRFRNATRKLFRVLIPDRTEMGREATEKRTQPGRDTGSQSTENARTEQANQTSVDLQRALHEAPVVGRNPLVSRGPQGSAPAVLSRRGSPAVWTGRTTSGPRGHYCLPLLLLPLCASCAAAFWSAECNGVRLIGGWHDYMDGFYFCDRAMPERCWMFARQAGLRLMREWWHKKQ